MSKPLHVDAAGAIAFLEALVEDRARLASLDQATRERLVRAAGAFLYPDPAAKRALAKEFRKRDKRAARATDELALAATGIRALRRAPIFLTPPPPDAAPREPEEAPARGVSKERTCYVCKARYRALHPFYSQLCRPCGDFNFAKRTQTADLRGRTALVTGARVKIGYQAAMMLLRAGARVLVTTRFPHDAALRYAREPDHAAFRDRLSIHGLDLRHTPSVEAFCALLLATEPRLDHVIHNACQTVRRPPGFYAHLMDGERAPIEALPAGVRPTLASLPAHTEGRLKSPERSATYPSPWPSPQGERGRFRLSPRSHSAWSAELSQHPLLAGDAARGGALFPEGLFDADLQQRDHRAVNSWRLPLAEVPTVELLEVQLVNAIAPFVLNGRLRALMTRTPERDKHLVNVSAMEGQFYRTFKTDKHPHTNMAKAALNMMTRTSAPDFVRDGLHMNSVDTGWVTDEDPVQHAQRKAAEGFEPPLDIVDGAARIVDPIFHGANTGEHHWGLFLKDYRPTPW